MRTFQAFVEVITPDYKYWNKLGNPQPTRYGAELDIAHYIICKAQGAGGFRKGAPGRTRIDEKELAL